MNDEYASWFYISDGWERCMRALREKDARIAELEAVAGELLKAEARIAELEAAFKRAEQARMRWHSIVVADLEAVIAELEAEVEELRPKHYSWRDGGTE